MAEPLDMIMPKLQAMRAEIAASRVENKSQLDALETGQKRILSALAGELLVNRITIGDFEGRISALELQIGELKGQK